MAKMNSESKKEVEEAKVCQQRPRSTFNCLSFRSFLTFVFHKYCGSGLYSGDSLKPGKKGWIYFKNPLNGIYGLEDVC